MAVYAEPYSISPARTGDAVLRDLNLTGWGNAPTFMEQGRLYWKVTSNGASSTLKLYREEALAAGDEVATSSTFTISSTAFVTVTLAQANSSGLSGSCRVRAGATSTGDCIITYAVEDDLKRVTHDLTSLLSSSQWEGVARFEGALRQAKQEIDGWIRDGFPVKASGERDISGLAAPRELAMTHAYLTTSILMENRVNLAPEKAELVTFWRKRAKESFAAIKPSLDFTLDDVMDSRLDSAVVSLRRA